MKLILFYIIMLKKQKNKYLKMEVNVFVIKGDQTNNKIW